MRRWTIVLTTAVLSAAPSMARAQSGSLFTTPVEVGAYFSAGANIGRVNGASHVFAGADFGVLLNHRFSLALTGEGLVKGDDDEPSTGEDRLRLGYGGIALGYVIAPTSILHYVAEVTVAGGSARRESDEPNAGDDDGDHIFVLQPSVSVE